MTLSDGRAQATCQPPHLNAKTRRALPEASTVTDRKRTVHTHPTPQPLRRSSRKRKMQRLAQGIDFSMHRPPRKARKPDEARVASNREPSSNIRIAAGRGPTMHLQRQRRKPTAAACKRNSIAAPPKPKRLRQTQIGRFMRTTATSSTTQDRISMEELLNSWNDIHGDLAARDRAGEASLGQAGPPPREPPPFASLLPLIEGFHPGVDPGDAPRR